MNKLDVCQESAEKHTDEPVGKLIKDSVIEGTKQSSSLRAGGSPVTADQLLSTANTCTRVDMRLSAWHDPPDE